MNTYSSLSFFGPFCLTVLATVAWVAVLYRLNCLTQISRWKRYAVMVWIVLLALVGVNDLAPRVYYADYWQIVTSVAVKCVMRLGMIMSGIWIHHLIGRAYPVVRSLSHLSGQELRAVCRSAAF